MFSNTGSMSDSASGAPDRNSFARRTPSGASQEGLGAPAVLRVAAIGRHEDETRQEAPEGVAPHEQADALTLAEVEDPHRDLEQLVEGHLEDLVARVVLEDLDERLLVVAPVREGGLREDQVDLAPEDRDLARAGVVRGGRVEAEEAALAGHAALVVEALDANVVEERRPVDGRP